MKERLEHLEKTPLIIAGVLYVLGIIVVSINLNQYGVSTPANLFRVHYLLAGLWVMTPFLFVFLTTGTLACLVLFVLMKREGANRVLKFIGCPEIDSKNRFLINSLVFTAIIFLIVSSVIIVQTFALKTKVHYWRSPLIHACGMQTAFILIFVRLRLKSRGFPMEYGSYLFILITAYSPVLYIINFSTTAYATIPYRFGGGKPATVLLLLKANDNQEQVKKQLKRYNIRVDSENVTDECLMLYSTDNEIALLAGEQANSLVLPRDEFSGVEFSGNWADD